ncbi:hypothetical protein [Morganella morganii]|uniref:hypothetical protein n=1 Tax=Morganella morganii TaxID=582 RepID=UPI00236883BC|nr:hypothetical protein [Morganella morganii]
MESIKSSLLTAFNSDLRNEFSIAIGRAYLNSIERGKEFDSFAKVAQPYLRWFWCEALLEQVAKNQKISYSIAPNKAKNCNHLNIKSNNWSMTAHHASNGPLPRRASYRSMYAQRNYDLFEQDIDHGSILITSGHLYLMHDGEGRNVHEINFTVPSNDMRSVIYTERLNIISHSEVMNEKVEDELDEKINIKVDEILRRKAI